MPHLDGCPDPYSDRFCAAIDRVLAHEGGFVDHPDDPGGATKYGVSLRWLQRADDSFPVDGDIDDDGDVDVDDIRSLKPKTAAKLYHRQWWKRHGYQQLPYPVGEKAFDMAINMGSRQAHTLLQRACGDCGHPTTVDGLMGPNTRSAARQCDPQTLTDALADRQLSFYRSLAEQNDRYTSFIDGWTRRAEAYRSQPFESA